MSRLAGRADLGARGSLRSHLRSTLAPGAEIARRLIERRARSDEALRDLYDLISDDEARLHFGQEPLEHPQLRSVIRLFHAWKVATIRRRLGDALPGATALDVGDSDGLLLRDLGKRGTGLNLAEAAIENIRRNHVEAVQGDAHALPFPESSFDLVCCFETLEHVESPHAVLLELARVCRPEGHCFVSVPWVPETVIHARSPDRPRGREHVFELDRDDFAALLTHTPFEVVFEDVCWVFGEPFGLTERLFLWRNRGAHVVAETFRGFQLFELKPRPATTPPRETGA